MFIADIPFRVVRGFRGWNEWGVPAWPSVFTLDWSGHDKNGGLRAGAAPPKLGLIDWGFEHY